VDERLCGGLWGKKYPKKPRISEISASQARQ
jgi:hypothetical protein